MAGDLSSPDGPEAIRSADAKFLSQTAIELFGPSRAMFESNFPVDKVSSSYGVVWNAFKRITSGYTAGDKALLYHDTAARVYRLA